jgi:hypothetical protein
MAVGVNRVGRRHSETDVLRVVQHK